MLRRFCCLMFMLLFATTGCATKVTLPPIDGDLKPEVKLAGKVHVMPIGGEGRVYQMKNGYYSTVSATDATDFISSTSPVQVVGKSITDCLTQSGMVVTSGPQAPEDTNIVLAPKVENFYGGTDNPLWAANFVLAATTRFVAIGSCPNAALEVSNTFEDRATHVKSEKTFKGKDFTSLGWTKGGGVERAFRLVEEQYCGWLQKQIADLQANPARQEQKKAENKEL